MHVGGKIEQRNKQRLQSRDDLSMAYTPGVARVCLEIRDDPAKAFRYTIKQNYVAVVTDGTAGAGTRRHRARGRPACHGGQGDALQGVRRRGRLPHRPGHDRSGRDRLRRQADRPRLRRNQPRGHLVATLLRGRGEIGRGARHPSLPRRPARDRRCRDGRAVQCAQADGQANRGPASRHGRSRRSRHRCRPGCCFAPGSARSSAATPRG